MRDVIVGLVLGFGLFTAFTQYLGVSLPAGLTPHLLTWSSSQSSPT